MIAISESDLSLVEKYRPRTLAEVRGQEEAKRRLVPYCKRPVSKAFLFFGPSGTGKTSAALAMGRDLGVVVDDGEFGGFYEIKAGEQGIDQLKALLRRIPVSHGFGNTGSGHKLVLIEEAEGCSKDAARWWQTAVEEIRRNVPRCTIIFTTNYPEKMNSTLRSRFSAVEFKGDRQSMIEAAESMIADLWRKETGRTDSPPPLSDFPEFAANDSGEINLRALTEQFEDYLIVNEIGRTMPSLVLESPKQSTPSLFAYVGNFATKSYTEPTPAKVETTPTIHAPITPEPTHPIDSAARKRQRILEISIESPELSSIKIANQIVSELGGTCSKETVNAYRRPRDTSVKPITLATLPTVTITAEPCCAADEPEPCTTCIDHTTDAKPTRPALTLTIGGSDYSVHVLGKSARVLLDKPDGSAYAVSRMFTTGQEQCDCPDFQHRHKSAGTDCKHIAALRAVGMLGSR
jgi:hypothetical protein